MWSWLRISQQSLLRSPVSLSLSHLHPSSVSCELSPSPVLLLRIIDLHSPTGDNWLFLKPQLEVIVFFQMEFLCSVFRFYESMYDNAEYLKVSYPSNMTQEDQLDFLTDTAKVSFCLLSLQEFLHVWPMTSMSSLQNLLRRVIYRNSGPCGSLIKSPKTS